MSLATPIQPEWAEKIYDVLIEICGASDDEVSRLTFVHQQGTGDCREYQFKGVFSFGGKFWNDHRWYVNYYLEEEEHGPHFKEIAERANKRLKALYSNWLKSLADV